MEASSSSLDSFLMLDVIVGSPGRYRNFLILCNFSSDSELQLFSFEFMRIALSRAFSSNNLTHNLHTRTLTTFYHLQYPLSPLIRYNSSFTPMGTRSQDTEFVREDLEDLLKRRFFLSRAFDIYGGVAGLYDLGVHPIICFSNFIASRMCSSSKYCRHMASSFCS